MHLQILEWTKKNSYKEIKFLFIQFLKIFFYKYNFLIKLKSQGNIVINDEFNNFKKIHVPQCLNRPPKYQFISQFIAIFMRRFYYTVRNLTNWISFTLGFVLLIAATIVVKLIPVPIGINQDSFQIGFTSFFLVLSYSFNSSIFITLPVLEREFNLKYALNVMGCRVLPYWFGTLLFDVFIFLLTLFIFFIACLIQNCNYILNHFGIIFFILSTFCISYITCAYFFGFLFQKSNNALKFYPLFSYFIIYSLPWILVGLIYLLYNNDYLSDDTYVGLNGFCQVICLIFSPLFNLNMSFNSISGDFKMSEKDKKYFHLTIQSTYAYIGFNILTAFMYFALTFIFEQKKYGLKNTLQDESIYFILRQLNQIFILKKGQKQQLINTFEDVQDSLVKEEVYKVNDSSEEKIRVNGLIKQYDSGLVAVKNIQFCVKPGEIFGLLGPNGAGKSTTFSILTSLIPKTYGSIQIKGIEVDKGIMQIYQDVGICPQFDCLWESLTPPEHLYLFGRMKGLTGNDLNESVQYFLDTMQLTDFIKKKAGQLSGGNKRKLCVANALIGGPDIQFFDEPSTGVDPIARRFLWNTLNMGIKLRNSAICMTTHTMEEAESLCNKIGILINGQFYTIGTPQQLRSKYGQGYTITFNIEKQNNEKVKKILEDVFIKVVQVHDKREDYTAFQIDDNVFSFFKAFNVCEEVIKKQGLIKDFSINQSSLESVFFYFSKQQKQKDDEHNSQLNVFNKVSQNAIQDEEQNQIIRQ
ncbi:hypothetical protein IMG5_188760 [Ichthyophthirius multifiliis]|uniref:ABC transporter domain-containing protein n=1 Tax=Ichthyophthirius multifiliis TaxID=5932 RepID=G0R409_ICHMU|nr:hypothetical protein IMG5_188760 [Ichthyophthirius multifiliis]EGR27806.1 hypothetical protein IMG5_188760 [Ichthyophthirius multifiliis]|eukprot:XP_004027151.1 hypothetical protein IMG5_188760 [Ichthyophthirius multifiliis]